jgi:uncharacterized membrane protein
LSTSYLVKLYLSALAVFLAIDLVWLGVVGRGFYQKHLGYLLAARTNWAAAIVFYLLFVAGLLVFAVQPGLQAGSLGRTLLLGAFYGLVTYATYDLTNLATVRDWPLILTVVDLTWGMVLSTAVSAAAFWAGQWLG